MRIQLSMASAMAVYQLLALLFSAVLARSSVIVTDTGYTESKIGGQIYLERLITIDTGRRIFSFKSNGASIGMPLPVQMNWKMNELTRAVATAKRTEVLRPGERAFTFRLKPEERWLFLHDAVFDLDTPAVDTRKGGGGCALFYNPAEVESAEVAMANYHCDAYFTYGPVVKEMHLLVYDFSFERTNQNAMDYLKSLDSQGVSTGTPNGHFIPTL
jgi:hypothetical protein